MPDKLTHILYAEDEDDIRTIAQIALEDIGGFTVTYCSSGRKALEAAKEINPDLLLFDVMMPEMDGPTTLREIRKLPNCEHTPIIFMTAKIQAAEIDEYNKLGAIATIAKPFDPLSLAAIIQQAWIQHHAR